MRKATISLVQMDVEFGDFKANVERAFKYLEKAGDRETDIAVLPEMWTHGFDYDSMSKLAPSFTADIVDLLKDIAYKYGMYIVAGTICEVEEARFYNTSYIIGPEKNVIGKYRKVHLLKELGEPDFFSSGYEIPAFETAVGRIGAAICYDIRFPELFRQMAIMGSEIICVPAQFPRPREEHWETLIRARAIENQLFMAAANRVGEMEQLEYFGRSMIVGPYGETIAEGGEKEEVITEIIDIDKMYEVRKFLPTLSERRPDVYEKSPTLSFLNESLPLPQGKKAAPFKFKNTIQPMKPRQ